MSGGSGQRILHILVISKAEHSAEHRQTELTLSKLTVAPEKKVLGTAGEIALHVFITPLLYHIHSSDKCSDDSSLLHRHCCSGSKYTCSWITPELVWLFCCILVQQLLQQCSRLTTCESLHIRFAQCHLQPHLNTPGGNLATERQLIHPMDAVLRKNSLVGSEDLQIWRCSWKRVCSKPSPDRMRFWFQSTWDQTHWSREGGKIKSPPSTALSAII